MNMTINKRKVITALSILVIFTLMTIAGAQSLFSQNYYGLTLNLNNNQLTLKSFERYTSGADILSKEGDYHLQIISQSNVVLYENKFIIPTQLIPEPGPQCFDEEGTLTCDMFITDLDETQQRIFIPSFEDEKTISISKGAELLLEFDINDPPVETLEIGCEEETPDCYTITTQDIFVIIKESVENNLESEVVDFTSDWVYS